jgi:hypothetical protein
MGSSRPAPGPVRTLESSFLDKIDGMISAHLSHLVVEHETIQCDDNLTRTLSETLWGRGTVLVVPGRLGREDSEVYDSLGTSSTGGPHHFAT